MNEYIDILSSDDSTIVEQLNAVQSLQQYKLDTEKVLSMLKDDCIDTDINIGNINTYMSDIKKKLDKIDFENLNDIVKLHKLKSQIMTCNHILNHNKINIKVIDNGNSIDITDKIKDKFVIADFLKDDNTVITKEDNTVITKEDNTVITKDDSIKYIFNKQYNKTLTSERANSDTENNIDLQKDKIFSCFINGKHDIDDVLTIVGDVLSDSSIFRHKNMIFPDFDFTESCEIKTLKKYVTVKYSDDDMYFNMCLDKDNNIVYAFIEQDNNYFYFYTYDMSLYILTNDFNFILNSINGDKKIHVLDKNTSINEIINQLYTTVVTLIVDL